MAFVCKYELPFYGKKKFFCWNIITQQVSKNMTATGPWETADAGLASSNG